MYPRYLLLMVAIFGLAPAQTGVITGTVFDSQSGQPLEYANLVLYAIADSAQVTGTITNAAGEFTLAPVPPGTYYVAASFIGYGSATIDSIKLNSGARLDLGRIEIKPTALAVPGVSTVGDRPADTFELDKKVIDVSKLPNASSGTAVDALQNVPSVKVDIEGRVTLRGSSNFRVLIDGRPSPVEGNDALKQIPAATIDKIEVITNPSAKYDPEGTAGVFNIILKKQIGRGISALANANAGLTGRYGGYNGRSISSDTVTVSFLPADSVLWHRDASYWQFIARYFFVMVDHEHQSDATGHKLTGRAQWVNRDDASASGNEESDSTCRATAGRRTEEPGPFRRLSAELEYALPTGDNSKLEAGLESRIEGTDQDFRVYLLDPAVDTGYRLDPRSSHRCAGTQNTHSICATWSGTLILSLRFPSATMVQLNGSFSGPSITATSTSGTWHGTDLAVKQFLFNRALSITLRCSNLFGPPTWKNRDEGPGFLNTSTYTGEGRVLSPVLSYNFNNFRPDPKMQAGEGIEQEGTGGAGGRR